MVSAFVTNQRGRATALLLLLFFLSSSSLACSGTEEPEVNQGEVEPGDEDSDGGGDLNPDPDGDGPGDSDIPGDGDDGDGDRNPGNGDDWVWDDDFFLQAISPARGPLVGGTSFQISGTGFTPQTRVLFDTREVDVNLSQGQLIGLTPSSDTAGPVTVRVITEDNETQEIQNGFTYSNGLQVQSILPDRVPTTGGVEITLQGSGFTDQMGVSFDGLGARRITVINQNTARVVVPAAPRGRADLRVSIPDESILLPDRITFYRPLEVTEVLPGVGGVGGGDSIRIVGSGFTADTQVEIGDVPATIEAIQSNRIDVRTPPGDVPGAVDLFLENQDDALRLRNAFFYDTNPLESLANISPSRAPLQGGTEHILSGRGLDQAGLTVTVGTAAATILDAQDSSLRIQAPPSTAGAKDVILRVQGVEMGRLESSLLYGSRPDIDAISPTEGPEAGGTTVTITGEGFAEVTSVTLGELPLPFTVVDSDTIEVVTTRSEPGLATLRIHSPTGSATLEGAFRFVGDLQVWSMRPSRGAIAGGTYVTIQGRGFDGLIGLEVGSQEAREIRRLDPYTVTFRTPSVASSGPRDVTLSAMGMSRTLPYPFVYFNPMSSFGGASGSSVDGAVNVTVVTNDGSPIPGAYVTLSTQADTAYRGFTNTNGQITLSGPGVLGPQTIIATAPEFSTYMVRHLNAQNMTIILSPIEADGGGGQGSPPPAARISGNLTISGKSEDPGGGEDLNMSVVRTTRVSRTGATLNPGPNSVVAGEGPFSILSRVGDMALVALCGVYDATTEEFTPKFMAVERFLFLSDGDHQQVDLDCDIPLSQSLSIKIVDPVWAPDGPVINEISTFIDFGFEGYFRIPGAIQSLDDILVQDKLPALEGPLHDLAFSVIAGSFNGLGVPYTQTWVEEITDLSRLHATVPLVAVPELLSPAPAGIVDGNLRIGLKGTNMPDFFYIIFRNGLGLPVLTLLVPGYETTIPIPEFPDFTDLPPDARPEPLQPGLLYGVAYGIRIDDFRFHGYTNRDLVTSRWSAFSVATWQIRLTP